LTPKFAVKGSRSLLANVSFPRVSHVVLSRSYVPLTVLSVGRCGRFGPRQLFFTLLIGRPDPAPPPFPSLRMRTAPNLRPVPPAQIRPFRTPGCYAFVIELLSSYPNNLPEMVFGPYASTLNPFLGLPTACFSGGRRKTHLFDFSFLELSLTHLFPISSPPCTLWNPLCATLHSFGRRLLSPLPTCSPVSFQ